MAAPWPGRGSAPGSGAHLGSPRVLHDLVVIIRHVAHRRVRRVRRVRGGVWPRGFRGKFLTDCEYLSNSDQVTGRNPTLRKGIKGRTKRCSERARFTFSPHCLFLRDWSRPFVHQKKSNPRFQSKAHDPSSSSVWHRTTKKCFLRRGFNCYLVVRPLVNGQSRSQITDEANPWEWRKGIRV